jgi:glucokinase
MRSAKSLAEPSQPPTLLADIGGTNARFAILADGELGQPRHFDAAAYPTALDAMRDFLRDLPQAAQPSSAVLAAAGPVQAGRIHLTNSKWLLDTNELARELHLKSVDLINDFAAQGWALPALAPADVRQFGGGQAAADTPQAVLGAGTGFGLAVRAPSGGNETIIVTEGGHVTLAAENDAEDAVLRGLRAQHGHVSVERVLSGPGLVALYAELARQAGDADTERTAPAIVAHGVAGDCPRSVATLKMFCGWLGSVAGNIALTTGARGGVYLSGGVVARFLDFLAASTFRDRFEAKGRMTPYLQAIPVFAITHPDPAFLGLARFATRHAQYHARLG